MPITFVEDKANLRDDLRTNFPEFQTFILITPTIVMVPDGYSQPLYDYLTANCTIVADPRPTTPSILTIGSVTAASFSGQRAYSPAHDQWFTWNPDAGAAGEWWGEVRQIEWGSSGTTSNGTPFRILASLTTSSGRGYPIPGQIRCLKVSGKWDGFETGLVDIRLNGASAFNFQLTNQESTNQHFNKTNSNYLITPSSGDAVSNDSESNYLQFYWVNSNSGSIRRSQFRMNIVDVLLSGD